MVLVRTPSSNSPPRRVTRDGEFWLLVWIDAVGSTGEMLRRAACQYQDLSVERTSVKPSCEARNFHLIETITRNSVRKEKPCSQSWNTQVMLSLSEEPAKMWASQRSGGKNTAHFLFQQFIYFYRTI